MARITTITKCFTAAVVVAAALAGTSNAGEALGRLLAAHAAFDAFLAARDNVGDEPCPTRCGVERDEQRPGAEDELPRPRRLTR